MTQLHPAGREILPRQSVYMQLHYLKSTSKKLIDLTSFETRTIPKKKININIHLEKEPVPEKKSLQLSRVYLLIYNNMHKNQLQACCIWSEKEFRWTTWELVPYVLICNLQVRCTKTCARLTNILVFISTQIMWKKLIPINSSDNLLLMPMLYLPNTFLLNRANQP